MRAPTFEGRGVLVAGAPTAGVVAIAQAAAAAGAEVVLCGGEGPAHDPPRVWTVAADIAEEAEVERLFDRACEQLPSLDVLICVLPAPASAPLAELDLGEWQSEVIAPLRGAFLLCRRAVEEFVSARRPGRIVFVAGWPAAPTEAANDAGDSLADVLQAALHSLSRSIAKEYGRRGIACNLVVPADPMLTSPRTPLVETLLFLASDQASFINGESLTVGGTASAGVSNAAPHFPH